MKNTLIIVSLLILFSCADNSGYEIQGHIPNAEFEDRQVYLLESKDNYRGYSIIDSARIKVQGFNFKGIASEPDIYNLSFTHPDEAEEIYPVIIENGIIKVTFDSVCNMVSVKGTTLNDDWNNINKQVSENNALLEELYYKDSLSIAEIDQYRNYQKRNTDLTFGFIRTNMKNEVGKELLLSSKAGWNKKQLTELLSGVDSGFLELRQIKNMLSGMENENKMEVGKFFSDVAAVTPEGTKVMLSDYVGKGDIVFLDFWASWCAPCIEDIPNVKKAYDKYKDKGFKVVGVSLDDDRDKWTAAINRLNLQWAQLSDLKGWDSDFVKHYPARPIPYTVLLDGEGKVLETRLRGNMLLSTLSKYID